jgi:glutathione S-transferase
MPLLDEDRPLLYSFRRCPFAMRVRFALHEKGVAFDIQEEKLDQFSDALKALHPESKVPLLVHRGMAIYESAIITEYIDEAFPSGPPLMPADPLLRAEVRLLTYDCNRNLKPSIDHLKYGTSRFAAEECAGASERIQKSLEAYESRLKEHDWLLESGFSLADIHLFPFLRQLWGIRPPPAWLNDFPLVGRWLERVSNRPAFALTMAKSLVE